MEVRKNGYYKAVAIISYISASLICVLVAIGAILTITNHAIIEGLFYEIMLEEAEYYAVSEALYGSNATGAVTLQSYVQEREQWIAEYKAANEDLSYIESIEQAIEYCKTRIAALEAVVAARQVAVNNAKAELDAAMAEE